MTNEDIWKSLKRREKYKVKVTFGVMFSQVAGIFCPAFLYIAKIKQKMLTML